MIAIYLFCCTRVWMNASGMSTTATSMCSSASMMHVSSTDSMTIVVELAYSLEIKSLCLLRPTTVLPLMVLSIFYFRNRWDSSVWFFCSYDMFLQCSGRKVSLMCIWFISKWIEYLPFLPHLSRPALSDIWIVMAPTAYSLCLVIIWLETYGLLGVIYLCFPFM